MTVPGATRGVEAVAFLGGPILTMDSGPAEVVVVRGETIAAVGGRDLLLGFPDAQRVDLGGRTLVPGFIDAHNHLSIAALHPRFGDATGVEDRDSLVRAIHLQAAAEPEAEWIRLWGWNETKTQFVPTRADLDAAAVDRPIVLAHYSLHQCVASSAALDRLGIGRTSTDPASGEIGRDATGAPNGLLIERAWSDAHARSLAAYTNPDRWADHIAARAKILIREGIVAVHDAACPPHAEAVYQHLARLDSLPVSVLVMPHSPQLLTNDAGPRLTGPPTGEGDHRLRVGPMKLFADGGVAIALDVRLGGHRVQYGYVMEDLEAHARRATRAGFRIAVHAIGNLGVEHTISAFQAVRQETGDRDHRFRIEHAGVTGLRHWRDLADLHAVAVVQPGFVEHIGCQTGGLTFDDDHWLAFKGLADAGVTLAGSSDDPCAPFPPLWCATKGASRTTSTGIRLEPDQGVTFEDWLAAYTTGAARAGGQENERGRIAAGLRADLVVLQGSAVDARVSETWISGRVAYRAPAGP